MNIEQSLAVFNSLNIHLKQILPSKPNDKMNRDNDMKIINDGRDHRDFNGAISCACTIGF